MKIEIGKIRYGKYMTLCPVIEILVHGYRRFPFSNEVETRSFYISCYDAKYFSLSQLPTGAGLGSDLEIHGIGQTESNLLEYLNSDSKVEYDKFNKLASNLLEAMPEFLENTFGQHGYERVDMSETETENWNNFINFSRTHVRSIVGKEV